MKNINSVKIEFKTVNSAFSEENFENEMRRVLDVVGDKILLLKLYNETNKIKKNNQPIFDINGNIVGEIIIE